MFLKITYTLIYGKDKRKNLVYAPDSHINKALVAMTVEQSLLEIGKPVFDEVTRVLYKDYKCYISDCYEHPEYLKNVLQTLYGPSHLVMVESIRQRLEEFTDKRSIENFVKVISG